MFRFTFSILFLAILAVFVSARPQLLATETTSVNGAPVGGSISSPLGTIGTGVNSGVGTYGGVGYPAQVGVSRTEVLG
ncbi:unnamed protein product [Bursaphelenchus xylophilus]|uniref:(pine wood nematode) hypothetical protein n=1 Tax=Bursaphelenchus xylophilus TaxID=6326 RepID=A0A1I7SDL4_BURXY|nr:unnamed protein product [Bursaphelenchus xylophilus]CAG9120844.1 unnamed protein product [Bursaphelenchus xylophilus]